MSTPTENDSEASPLIVDNGNTEEIELTENIIQPSISETTTTTATTATTATTTNTDSNADQLSTSSMQVLNGNDAKSELIDNTENKIQSITDQVISAAQHGDINVLKHYLTKSTENQNPLSPNLTDADGITLVHWAALNNKLTAVKFLVSIGADPDVPAGDMHATPLLWAARYGLVYIVDYLIRDAKVKVDIVDKNGIGVLLASVFSSNVMMVVYIIWTLNQAKDSENNSVGLDGIDVTDPKGRTPLHWAAYQGDFLTVDVLLAAGADCDLIDDDGFTALHWGLVGNSKLVVSSLVAAKCNLNIKNKDGKNAWNVASDMKCTPMFSSVLKENSRDPISGEKVKRILTENQAKIVTFFIPYVTLPCAIGIISSKLGTLPKFICLLILFITHQVIMKKVVKPCFNRGKISLMRTPFFAGVFSATLAVCLILWLFILVPYTLLDENFFNLLILTSSTTVLYLFIKSMTLDPGFIPKESDPAMISQTIFELLRLRQFDSNHFCIYSNIRKPLRSKFSRDHKLNIARFDHYCPWVNNNVGVRNHKVFVSFAFFLDIAIFAWINLVMEYFDELPEKSPKECSILYEDLCAGYYGSPFVFYFSGWVLMQAFWLSLLLLVQFIQISKGTTTYEFSHFNKAFIQENSFSSVPTDDPQIETPDDALGGNYEDENDSASEVEDIEANLSQSLLSHESNINDDGNTTNIAFTMRTSSIPFLCISKLASSRLCRAVGLEQMFILTSDFIQEKKSSSKRNFPFNYGFTRNWLDFLFLRRVGDAYSIRTLIAIPLRGESNLNDVLVDYYQLYTAPETV